MPYHYRSFGSDNFLGIILFHYRSFKLHLFIVIFIIIITISSYINFFIIDKNIISIFV
jgi:hypothetical protein